MFDNGALVDLCRRYGVRYEARDMVVHEQEPTTDLCLVVSGEVEFSAGGVLLKCDQDTAMQLVGSSLRFALRVVQTLGDCLRTTTARADQPAAAEPPRLPHRPMTIGQVIRASG